jgi:hypothetical protein
MIKKREDVQVSSSGLETLLNKILEACEADIEETEQNIAFYKSQVMNDVNGKEMYGTYLNDALKIKGQARDRYIKIINIWKDRVKVKEILEKASGTDESPENLLKAIDEFFETEQD